MTTARPPWRTLGGRAGQAGQRPGETAPQTAARRKPAPRKPAPRKAAPRKAAPRLSVSPIACDGRGLCAELLPELITLDDWGYPVIADGPVPARLLTDARVAVRACPKLALRLG